MKKIYLSFLLATVCMLVARSQDVEKKIIRAQKTVRMTLAAPDSAFLIKNLRQDSLLMLVNKYRTARRGFNNFTGQLTIDSLRDQAIIVLSNVNPRYVSMIPRLVSLRTVINQYTINILSQLNGYNSMTTIGETSLENAIERINEEMVALDMTQGWNSYRTIKDGLLRATITTGSTSAADAIDTAVKLLYEIREHAIKEYNELYEWSLQISEHPQLTILHSANGTTWDDDPVNCRKLMIVLIDANKKLALTSFYAENFKSAVTQEFNELMKFIKNLGVYSMGAKGMIPLSSTAVDITFLEVNRSKIDPPGNIVALTPFVKDGKIVNDTVKVRIKEKIYFGFRVGLSTAQIDRKVFKIDNKQLVIELDSAEKEEWKEHLMMTFNFNPWHRTEDYSPKMFSYDRDNSFLKRISLFTGFNLSLQPLDNIYLGVAYDFSKNFTLNAGCTFNNTLESGKIDIGDINTVKDALKLSNKEYDNGKWFFALTFRPAVISEILGLNKEDK